MDHVAQQRSGGRMGTLPNSLGGGGGGRRGHEGRRAALGIPAAGSGGQRCSSLLYKARPPRPPSLLPALPSSLGAGRGRGGTLAVGRVEKAVQSPVTSPAAVKTSGGLSPARGREVQESACPGTIIKFQLPISLHDFGQVTSLGPLSLFPYANVCVS